MRRMTRVVLTLVLGATLGSCSTTHQVPVASVVEHPPGGPGEDNGRSQLPSSLRSSLAAANGAKINEYTTADGVRHALDGTARVEHDSIFIQRPARAGRGLEAPITEVRLALPAGNVQSLGVVVAQPARTTWLVVALASVVTFFTLAAMYLDP
jgi:hypothetical protein